MERKAGINEAHAAHTEQPFYKKTWFIVVAALFVLGAIGNAFDIRPPKDTRSTPETKQPTAKAEIDPLSLAPATLASLTRTKLEKHQTETGGKASYEGTADGVLGAELLFLKVATQLPPVDATNQEAKAGAHPARLYQDNTSKEISLYWRVGDWYFALTLRCSVDPAQVKPLLLSMASQVASTEQVMGGQAPVATNTPALAANLPQPKIESFPDEAKVDALGGVFYSSFLVRNVGDTPAKINSCDINITSEDTSAGLCLDGGRATLMMRLLTLKDPKNKKSKEDSMIPITYADRLQSERVILPKGEYLVWRKIPLKDLKACNFDKITASLSCQTEGATTEGWPEVVPLSPLGK